jgi:hypothetical protein
LDVSLFPNPTDNQITIQSETSQIQSVSVYNTVGSLVQRSAALSIRVQLDLNMPHGLYLLHIETERGMVVKKLVVK